jgi:UDP-N-acetylmuramoylalanine--D-glutamate ligase
MKNQTMTDLSALSGLRVLVVGLGREGIALVEYLAGHGFTVTATDRQPEEKLGDIPGGFAISGVKLVAGGHPAWLLEQTDILFVSPGVPLEIPFLQQAQQRGLPLTTESRLFCHLCPAPIIGITGSSGKTTTTTLVGKMLEADGYRTWVGGNIGRPLIAVVDNISSADKVVMELSSFQLEFFHASLNQAVDISTLPAENPDQLAQLLGNWSPPVAAMLNITPNHLDRHPSMKHYVHAKRSIIDHQDTSGVIVTSLDNDMTRTVGRQFQEKVHWFSIEAQIPGGAAIVDGRIAFVDDSETVTPIAAAASVKLRGDHNMKNILAACLLAREGGASVGAMRSVITTFAGVEHRLQPVRTHRQVGYIDDSIATTPERVVAALRSFREPIILLAGGRDKHLPWEEAARLIQATAREVILFGEAAPIIDRALRSVKIEEHTLLQGVHHCHDLGEAVQLAFALAQAGDVVLLSPGCASYDQFTSYVERGHKFSELVMQL